MSELCPVVLRLGSELAPAAGTYSNTFVQLFSIGLTSDPLRNQVTGNSDYWHCVLDYIGPGLPSEPRKGMFHVATRHLGFLLILSFPMFVRSHPFSQYILFYTVFLLLQFENQLGLLQFVCLYRFRTSTFCSAN